MYRDRIPIVLETIIEAIGAVIAALTAYRYGIIVRGFLGLTVIFLLYREYVLLKSITRNAHLTFETLKDIKYPIINFLTVMIMVWSGAQVLEMIWYLIRIFTNR